MENRTYYLISPPQRLTILTRIQISVEFLHNYIILHNIQQALSIRDITGIVDKIILSITIKQSEMY